MRAGAGLGGLSALCLLAACSQDAADSLGPAWDPRIPRLSEGGAYLAEFVPEQWPPPLNRQHQWQLQVRRADGRPVSGLSVKVDGDMPAHRHGLPTVPEVLPNGDEDRFDVRGLQFHMPGIWRLQATIEASNGLRDTAIFDFRLSTADLPTHSAQTLFSE